MNCERLGLTDNVQPRKLRRNVSNVQDNEKSMNVANNENESDVNNDESGQNERKQNSSENENSDRESDNDIPKDVTWILRMRQQVPLALAAHVLLVANETPNIAQLNDILEKTLWKHIKKQLKKTTFENAKIRENKQKCIEMASSIAQSLSDDKVLALEFIETIFSDNYLNKCLLTSLESVYLREIFSYLDIDDGRMLIQTCKYANHLLSTFWIMKKLHGSYVDPLELKATLKQVCKDWSKAIKVFHHYMFDSIDGYFKEESLKKFISYYCKEAFDLYTLLKLWAQVYFEVTTLWYSTDHF